MSTLRLWVIGAVLASVVIIALGWFLGVSPRLAEVASAEAERQSVETINVGYEATLIELQQLSAELPALSAELDALRLSIPADPALSPLLGELNALAESSGVFLDQVVASPPALFPEENLEGSGVIGLVVLPVTIEASGPGTALDSFVEQVQFGERLILVTSIDLTEDPVSGSVILTGFIFVLPPDGAALPTEEATGEAPTDGAPVEEAPAEEAPAQG